MKKLVILSFIAIAVMACSITLPTTQSKSMPHLFEPALYKDHLNKELSIIEEKKKALSPNLEADEEALKKLRRAEEQLSKMAVEIRKPKTIKSLDSEKWYHNPFVTNTFEGIVLGLNPPMPVPRPCPDPDDKNCDPGGIITTSNTVLKVEFFDIEGNKIAESIGKPRKIKDIEGYHFYGIEMENKAELSHIVVERYDKNNDIGTKYTHRFPPE